MTLFLLYCHNYCPYWKHCFSHNFSSPFIIEFIVEWQYYQYAQWTKQYNNTRTMKTIDMIENYRKQYKFIHCRDWKQSKQRTNNGNNIMDCNTEPARQNTPKHLYCLYCCNIHSIVCIVHLIVSIFTILLVLYIYIVIIVQYIVSILTILLV